MIPTTTLTWALQGQRRVEDAVDDLTEAEARADSALPGWSRGHVITHLARNADALVNLLTWAHTGIRTPMYPSGEHRTADIEQGASRGGDSLRSDLTGAGARFAAAAHSMPEVAWEHRVVSNSGRDMSAAEVPWMRVREVWLHLVDLRIGATIDDVPPDIAWRLVEDVAAWMSTRIEVTLELGAPGHGQVRMGPGEPAGKVSGTAAALAGWLTGRCDATQLVSDEPLPQLPPWL